METVILEKPCPNLLCANGYFKNSETRAFSLAPTDPLLPSISSALLYLGRGPGSEWCHTGQVGGESLPGGEVQPVEALGDWEWV